MRIAKASIKNFRSHSDTTLDFQKLHVILGENATGKTAILEALNYATSPYYLASRFDEQDFNAEDLGDVDIGLEFDRYFVVKIPDGYVTQQIPCSGVHLTVKRRDRATSGRAFSDGFVVSHLCEPVVFHDKAKINATFLPAEVKLGDLPDSVVTTAEGFEVSRKSGKPLKVRKDTVSVNSELVHFPTVFYFDRAREKEASTGFNSLLTKMIRDLNWRYRRGWTKDTVREQWGEYYGDIMAVVEENKKRDILPLVRQKASQLTGIDCSDLELSLLNIEQPFDKAFFSFRRDLNQIGLGGAGSGLSMAVAFCLLEVVSRLAGEDIIVLVDEPEMHMHPQVQKRLLASLREFPVQTIMTTHSSSMVDIGGWRSITRLDRNGSVYPRAETLAGTITGQSVAQHLDEIPKWKQHKTVFFESDAELFFARRVLLVEGPAEKYGVPRLSERELLSRVVD